MFYLFLILYYIILYYIILYYIILYYIILYYIILYRVLVRIRNDSSLPYQSIITRYDLSNHRGV